MAMLVNAARRLAIGIIGVAIGVVAETSVFAQEQQQSDEFNLRQRVEELDKAQRQRREQAAETDRAYQRILKSHSDIPTQKVDPWGNMRTTTPAKPNAQSAPPR